MDTIRTAVDALAEAYSDLHKDGQEYFATDMRVEKDATTGAVRLGVTLQKASEQRPEGT
jgi:hypothetical protein